MSYYDIRHKNLSTPFTTAPKSLIKRGHGTVRDRCIQFIDYLRGIGYETEIPVKEAKRHFQNLGILSQLSLESYFGVQQHTRERTLKSKTHYHTSGNQSQKTITFKETVNSKIGYFEILGLARFELRGHTCFMAFSNEPLVCTFLPREMNEVKVNVQ